MQIRVNMMGGLKPMTPDGGRLDAEDGATIEQVLEQLGVEAKQVQIVMHNGKPQANRLTTLAADDEITVLPPVGGG